MAKINKSKAVKQATGLPTKEQMLMSPANNDPLMASIKQSDGTEAPARLSEGEFVFSVPAIIALGEGSHEQGIQMLTEIHDELRAMSGEPQGGLSAA